ncbi:hypothetical protein FNF29_05458 [Cafeteria roenbergensis]|uniref:Uncharacterized protein n=1 Tax=Cafeteria roenbergensis TaxID=33653 RepID=A0A5A8DKA1_CAFRO|nr:hypothetical protein FNF29_05458 [Cafeteria roenbergensis]KAA0162225.1 hypothetical protein FNF28_04780 [Cafeteria roenbergensis]KAA0164410.1 hypothetical protein FNF31_02334 [Cafeteria roenbergensis]|eukprot:KAA0150218.1 hypothetical protein FNF29_05458 [Cafeteria roenbergensis]
MADAAAGDADAYEAMRQAAMEAKATMLAELGMGETKSNLEQRARAAKRPRASSAKARGSSARAAALAEPTRRSRRVAGREAEAAAGLPKELEYVTSASLARSFAERTRPEGTVDVGRLIEGVSNQDLSNAETLCREIVAPPATPSPKKPRRGVAAGPSGRRGSKADPADDAVARYRDLRIQNESHVAKVTPDRSYSCCFTGRCDVVVGWVGDKWGRVGAFRPLATATEEDESDLITLFAPHTRSVGSVMSPTDAPERIVSSSYDGSVRVFDAAAMRSSETIVWGEHLSYATVAPSSALGGGPCVVWAVSHSGELLMADLRAPRPRPGSDTPGAASVSRQAPASPTSAAATPGAGRARRARRSAAGSGDAGSSPSAGGSLSVAAASSASGGRPAGADADEPPPPACWDAHDAKACSVDHHPSLPLVLTSSNDTTAKLWDVRALGRTRKRATGGKAQSATPLAVFAHGRGASSAFFSHDGDRIVSTGNDDLIRVWGGGSGAPGPVASMSDATSRFADPAGVAIKHNNHTGRWLSNFRTVFEPLSGGHVVLVGAMGTRRIQFFSSFTGKLLHEVGDEEQLTAVPTINAFHPSLPLILSTTASGRAHLWS